MKKKFEEKFEGDGKRWSAGIRDQFIILALASEKGLIYQGQLEIAIGFNNNNGFDCIRAAKIAITRKFGNLFEEADGHGVDRVYVFREEYREEFKEMTMSHPFYKIMGFYSR
jgi:hypothetical protein